jgi:hypothetical protein
MERSLQIPFVTQEWVDGRKKQLTAKHPVGLPDADPTVAVKTISSLDHKPEVRPCD